MRGERCEKCCVRMVCCVVGLRMLSMRCDGGLDNIFWWM